jgi:hypothetical protein
MQPKQGNRATMIQEIDTKDACLNQAKLKNLEQINYQLVSFKKANCVEK